MPNDPPRKVPFFSLYPGSHVLLDKSIEYGPNKHDRGAGQRKLDARLNRVLREAGSHAVSLTQNPVSGRFVC